LLNENELVHQNDEPEEQKNNPATSFRFSADRQRKVWRLLFQPAILMASMRKHQRGIAVYEKAIDSILPGL
jgi:hypothetical protein